MPLQNRVTPFSRIEVSAARGLFTGNRGCLHDGARRLLTERWRSSRWICCTLTWKGLRRTPMTPGRWTELFFLDEAVALAAGHRPCAYCRRPEFNRFVEAWARATGRASDLPAPAAAFDAAVHPERLALVQGGPRARETAARLPDGAFVALPGQSGAWLKRGEALREWSHAGYLRRVPLPRGPVELVTAPAVLAALRAGYTPVLHPSAS